MREFYMTSFFKIGFLPIGVEAWSAAVYQPKGYSLPKAAWTDIRKDGKWTRPREFLGEPDPGKAYFDAMLALYESRKEEAWVWFNSLSHPVALCCWCPSDRAAQKQLKEWGSFICHTGPLGEFIAQQGFPVWYDSDRRLMYHP